MTTNIMRGISNNIHSKENNINKSNLYKVATGKMKSYKGLKLYNPLEH